MEKAVETPTTSTFCLPSGMVLTIFGAIVISLVEHYKFVPADLTLQDPVLICNQKSKIIAIHNT